MGRRAGATVFRLGGFDLHANTSVRAKNRPKLERLCRYLLRPPVAEDRLSLAPDGSVLVRLKTPWPDGTSRIALQHLELLEKLAALIRRPYVNLIVYHGVLAPNAKWRREVVDFGRPRVERVSSATTPKKVGASSNRSWAELMRCGLDIDVLECPDCGGRLRFVAAIMLSSAIRRILCHLGLSSQTLSSSRLRGRPPSSSTPGLVDRARPRRSSD
ncbi:MAG: transposase [Polyangiales bacterium]